MNLAATLRQALSDGFRTSPELLTGDLGDLTSDGQRVAAAVLIPIVDRPEPTVILTLRPETLRKHAGQVAFPGGRVDPEDDGPIDAALREAEEEIGLNRSLVDVIGTADPYLTITGFAVTPVIGVVPPDVVLVPQPEEVAAVFEAPLDFILHPEHQLVRTVEWQGVERSYYEIMWQDRRIWGATAAMIVNLSRRLARA